MKQNHQEVSSELSDLALLLVSDDFAAWTSSTRSKNLRELSKTIKKQSETNPLWSHDLAKKLGSQNTVVDVKLKMLREFLDPNIKLVKNVLLPIFYSLVVLVVTLANSLWHEHFVLPSYLLLIMVSISGIILAIIASKNFWWEKLDQEIVLLQAEISVLRSCRSSKFFRNSRATVHLSH